MIEEDDLIVISNAALQHAVTNHDGATLAALSRVSRVMYSTDEISVRKTTGEISEEVYTAMNNTHEVLMRLMNGGF